MLSKTEVQHWLATLEEGSGVAVDDGGLTLVEIDKDGKQTEAYLDLGGIPSKDQE